MNAILRNDTADAIATDAKILTAWQAKEDVAAVQNELRHGEFARNHYAEKLATAEQARLKAEEDAQAAAEMRERVIADAKEEELLRLRIKQLQNEIAAATEMRVRCELELAALLENAATATDEDFNKSILEVAHRRLRLETLPRRIAVLTEELTVRTQALGAIESAK